MLWKITILFLRRKCKKTNKNKLNYLTQIPNISCVGIDPNRSTSIVGLELRCLTVNYTILFFNNQNSCWRSYRPLSVCEGNSFLTVINAAPDAWETPHPHQHITHPVRPPWTPAPSSRTHSRSFHAAGSFLLYLWAGTNTHKGVNIVILFVETITSV